MPLLKVVALNLSLGMKILIATYHWTHQHHPYASIPSRRLGLRVVYCLFWSFIIGLVFRRLGLRVVYCLFWSFTTGLVFFWLSYCILLNNVLHKLYRT
jgi:hypothetical protein